MAERRGHRVWTLIPVLLLVLLCAAGWRAGPVAAVRAQDALTVTGTPTVENKFPAEIVFSIDAASTAAEIREVTLHYQLLPNGTGVSTRAEFDPGMTVHAVYHMRTAGNPLYLPPTKVLRYYWTLQDGAGNQAQTDAVDWMYQDPRFKFKTASNGNLTLYYFTGSDANARRILAVGRDALDKAATLNGAPMDFPIHLVTYGTQAEVGPALSHESRSVDPNILGQADPPDIVVLAAGDLSGADNEDTVRHELTHLVNAHAVETVSGRASPTFPLWLDEGLAVYAQKDPDGFRSAIEDAIRRDAVVPVKNLAPGLRGSDAGLFYGESWSVVQFLVSTYGPEKLAQLLAAFKAGQSEDAAFQKVYALDRNGIYDAWRKSVGLKAVAPAPAPSQAPARDQNAPPAPPPPRQGGAGPNSEPTVSPPAPPTRSTPHTGSSGDNLPLILLGVASGALILALLGLAVLGGLALSRRR